MHSKINLSFMLKLSTGVDFTKSPRSLKTDGATLVKKYKNLK